MLYWGMGVMHMGRLGGHFYPVPIRSHSSIDCKNSKYRVITDE